MKIITKYIIKENIKPFLGALSVITFLMLFNRLIELLNLIIEKKLDFITIVSIFGLSLPFMLALTIPMAVLVSTIMSFGRLSVDRETIAFKASGVNVYTLMRPTLVLSIFLSIFMVYFNDVILPESNHKLKNLLKKVASRRPITAIKPGVFTQKDKLTIYCREQIDDELFGIVIYDHKQRNYPRMISAKRGKIELSNGGNSLRAVLFDGEMQERDKKNFDKFNVTYFDSFTLNLPDLGFSQDDRNYNHRGDREMTSSMMRTKIMDIKDQIKSVKKEIITIDKDIEQIKKYPPKVNLEQTLERERNRRVIKENKVEHLHKNIREYKVEIHKKYSIAFACIIFVLIGAPIGLMTKSSGVGMAFSVSSLVFLLYYMSLYGGESLADRGQISPAFAMWISNILFGVIGIYLAFLTIRETHVIDIPMLIKKIKKRFSRKKIS